MKQGIYTGLSFEQYLDIGAVNKSSLDDMRLSPLHYWARHINPNRVPKPPTRPMKLGTDIHCAVLEPDRFSTTYVVEPLGAPKRPTKTQLEAKKPAPETIIQIAFWRDFDAANAGKTIISIQQHAICTEIAHRFQAHPVWEAMLSDGQSEVTLVWKDPVTGLLCKARVDWLPKLPFLLDIKSVECAADDEFGRKVADYDWHVQAAWYADGWKVLTGETRTFVFGAVEKTEPFEAAFYYAQETDTALGRATYRPLLNAIAEAKKAKQWPGYPKEIRALKLPAWMTKKEGAANEPELETY